jgi:hypothetical protein
MFGAWLYEAHHLTETNLGRGLFLHYELQIMKKIDKLMIHTYYIGFFITLSYILAV